MFNQNIAQPWLKGGIPITSKNLALALISNSKVSDFIDPYQPLWKVAQIRKFFSLKDAQFTIKSEPHDIHPNFMYWKGLASGYFSSKSAYAFIALNETPHLTCTKLQLFA